MPETLVIQGRQLQEQHLVAVRELITRHPEWSRRRLSQQLCIEWDWRNAAGQYKDMAARTLLLKLAARGLVSLPERRQRPTNRMRAAAVRLRLWDETPMPGSLAELGRLRVEEVSQDRAAREELQAALDQFHYLGSGGGAVGENLQYRVVRSDGRLVAVVWFGSAAWKCAARDGFIGWTGAEREANLWRITNNSRFLILPWVRCAHLGSWILGQVLRRLSRDWQSKYGHPIALVETFVEQWRFRGTIYRAANWQHVGETEGRTRQDRYSSIQVPVKDVYLYPLIPTFREVLRHGTA
jgi:uncharacterized protein YigA (DUF484 family)